MNASLVQYVAFAKDIVLAIAAIIGAVVAIRGLSTWNRQLKGNAEYDLTRRILRSTYALREAIKANRHFFMGVGEMPLPPEEQCEKMTREQRTHYGYAMGLQARWEKVTSARSELQAVLLEAEALWGNDVHAKYERLFQLQKELFVSIHTSLRISDPATSEPTREALSNASQQRREVMSDMSSEADDPYSKDLSQAIARIEQFLKPHLRNEARVDG